MIEQQLAERFRAVVDDEPPLGIHPDELVDRLLRQRRRRQAFATALGVVAVAVAAVAAVAGVTTSGGRPADPTPTYAVGAPPTATPPPTTQPALATESVDAVANVLPGGKFQLFPVPGSSDDDRYLFHLTVATSGLDKGLLQVRTDDLVFFEAALGTAGKQDFRYDVPIAVPAGQDVTVAVNCVQTMAADKLCRAGVTFQFTVADR